MAISFLMKSVEQLQRKIPYWQYLFAGVGFLVWIFFFDKNNLILQRERSNELKAAQEKLSYYEKAISATREELNALQNDPAAIEQYAREKYLLRKEDEIIFLVPLPGDSINNLPTEF